MENGPGNRAMLMLSKTLRLRSRNRMIMLPSSFSLFFLLLYVTKSTADSVLHVRVGENEFNDFVADDATMTCSADEHSHPFNAQLRGEDE